MTYKSLRSLLTDNSNYTTDLFGSKEGIWNMKFSREVFKWAARNEYCSEHFISVKLADFEILALQLTKQFLQCQLSGCQNLMT
jgi:hypothetical protein